jgi:hypothetical protein
MAYFAPPVRPPLGSGMLSFWPAVHVTSCYLANVSGMLVLKFQS